jgi:hypothetical protein
MRNSLQGRTLNIALLAFTLGGPATVLAAKPCDFVTRAEASALLGVSAGKKIPQKTDANGAKCLISAADKGHDTLKLDVSTFSPDDPNFQRMHTDEERGEEVPSLHDEPWYEVSAVDAEHPGDRRFVIHRSRTVLTLDLHSAHQVDAKQAFENIWSKIAERLPSDES